MLMEQAKVLSANTRMGKIIYFFMMISFLIVLSLIGIRNHLKKVALVAGTNNSQSPILN
jgi:hypothetical protein